jgi:putative heme-binding domain-containing protein
MDPGADPGPRKILPIGQGSLDLGLLRTIRDSGYRGPIGILGHTQDDAEERLRDNLDGLDWLVRQLEGKPVGPRPKPRTPVPAPPASKAEAAPGDLSTVAALLADARGQGDPRRGAEVFASTRFGCLTCHKVAGKGGEVGPDLSGAGACIKPEEVVESVLWPRLKVKEGYEAVSVATVDGRVRQGYRQSETDRELVLRDPASNEVTRLPRDQVEAVQAVGTLMPEGLAGAMSPVERRDLVRFLIDLGKPGSTNPDALLRQAHAPATFPTGSSRSIGNGCTTSMPRRPSTSSRAPRSRRCSPPTRASTAGSRATGGTRTRTSGPTAGGTRPTWGRSSPASSGERA